MRKNMKLGELLVRADVIDELQLKAALGEQHRWGRRLGVTLIKLGMIDEPQLVQALAEQLDLPSTSLTDRRVASEVIALVPARLAKNNKVIPLFVTRAGSTGRLFLGMEDPAQLDVLDDLGFRTGFEIQPVMMGPTEINRAIDRYYSRKNSGASPLPGETLISERSLGMSTARVPTPDTTSELAPDPRLTPTQSAGIEPEVSPESRELELMPTLSLDQEILLEEISDEAEAGEMTDLERALRETERTKLVLKAITQLLVEKHLLTLEQIQTKLKKLKGDEAESASKPSA